MRKQPLSKSKEKTSHYSKEILGTELRNSYVQRNGSSFSDVYSQLYSKNAPIEDGSSYERLTQKAYDLFNYHDIHVKTLDLFVFW